MIARPVRHALYQRAREIEHISATAPSLRTALYMDERVRRVSDTLTTIASVSTLNADLRKRLLKKQAQMSLFRQAVAHFAETSPGETVAMPPPRLQSEKE
jgi:hypothetical protein